MNIFGTRKITGLALIALLAGCGGDGTNPFIVDEEITQELEEGDPNVDLNNKYAWDPERGLTMNDVQYEVADDGTRTLVINNLPFDGSSKTYDETSIPLPGSTVFQSRTKTIGGIETDGVVTYYAVYVETDHLKGMAVAGDEWADFGYGGANIQRDSYTLPDVIDGVGTSEFRYSGVYAGTRKMGNGSSMELTSGKLDLILDIKDFDLSEESGLEGAITGTIYDKQSHNLDGSVKNDLPNMALKVVSFDASTGIWTAGSAQSLLPGTADTKASGEFDGMLAGTDADEIGGYVVTEGIAHAEIVNYQVVEWELETPVLDALGNPVLDGAGNPVVTVTTGVVTGLDNGGAEAAQNLVDDGLNVPLLTADLSDVPAGATTEVTIDDGLFTSDFNAQEIGVFVGEVIEGDFD